jgi:hypothetical protein
MARGPSAREDASADHAQPALPPPLSAPWVAEVAVPALSNIGCAQMASFITHL